MINLLCSACNNEMVNMAKIPDGILFKCGFCGSKKILIEDYNLKKNISGYSESYSNRQNKTKIAELINLFEKIVSAPSSKTELLDIGFGSGEFLIRLNEKGINVSGLECDKNKVTLLTNENIESYIGELGGQLNIEKKYDIVTLWDVIEHIDDIELVMKQLNSLVKIDGKLLILTPDSESIFDTLAELERRISFHKSQRIMNICLNRYHLHRFSTGGLKILLERFGFSIEKQERIQLFSLKSNEYTDGFAPGIIKWTKSSVINKLFSTTAMFIIRALRIRNKIFISAIKK